jgi:hypothetical protein
MKKHLFPSVLIVSLCVVFISFAKANNSAIVAAKKDSVLSKMADSSLAVESSLSERLYNSLQLQNIGLSKSTVEYALKGYQKLVDSGLVNKPKYLTIVDFSQSSRKKRFYILDMESEKLAWNTFVSHGKNSGIDMANNFSNTMSSEKSSLGFYVTKSTYHGKHGLSLRVGGLENGFNDNAEARGIVVHGAAYVNAGRVNSAYMGRSQGCPALPENEYAQVINIIKDGSVLFVYSPSEEYLQSSSLLN